MEAQKQTTFHGLKSVRCYGFILILALVALHVAAYVAVIIIEKNEIRHELAAWSQTLPRPDTTQPTIDLHLPQDILALHISRPERTGFYEIYTDKKYLVYANPENNYILAKSEEAAEHEITNIAIILGMLLAGEIVFILGWWMFAKSKIQELFEVA